MMIGFRKLFAIASPAQTAVEPSGDGSNARPQFLHAERTRAKVKDHGSHGNRSEYVYGPGNLAVAQGAAQKVAHGPAGGAHNDGRRDDLADRDSGLAAFDPAHAAAHYEVEQGEVEQRHRRSRKRQPALLQHADQHPVHQEIDDDHQQADHHRGARVAERVKSRREYLDRRVSGKPYRVKGERAGRVVRVNGGEIAALVDERDDRAAEHYQPDGGRDG